MLFHLSWNDNGDRFAVAVAVNRLVAAGHAAYRLHDPLGSAEAGDYLVEIGEAVGSSLATAGLILHPWQDGVPAEAAQVPAVRIAVLAGEASAYPYYGYYALALARLGLAYRPVSGADIAAGALESENLLILPGGFSNWSLDAKEQTQGADEAVRKFFREGGAAVVSCGGAFYLAKGRSTWLGLADARPRITQDYLRSGVGMVVCALTEGQHRLGLPPTLEIPYFHGPVFDEIGSNCEPLATFRQLNTAGRLFIDNPLRPEVFDDHMRGNIAVMKAEGARGRAVLFSPHPEMGDLLAKYMALETYIPHYLPIRGAQVMRETLDAYRPEESRSFLMVLNAVEDMASGARVAQSGPTPEPVPEASDTIAKLRAWQTAWQARAAELSPSAGGMAALETHVLDGLRPRLTNAVQELGNVLPRVTGGDGARLIAALAAIADHAMAAWRGSAPRRPAELLLELELAALLCEAWLSLCRLHQIARSDA